MIVGRIFIGTFILWLVSQSGYVIAETVTEYLPLNDGNFWTYKVTGNYGSYNSTIRVLPGTATVNGVQTKALRTSGGPWDGGIEYWTNDDKGIRLHRAYLPVTEAGPGMLTFVPPMVAANRDMSINETVNSSGKAVFTFDYYGTFNLAYDSGFKAARTATITVPSGTYDTIVFTGSYNITGAIMDEPYDYRETSIDWLAKNVGIIKDKYTDNTDSEISVLIKTNVGPPLRFLPFLPILLD